MMAQSECLKCGTELVADPQNAHWSRCPKCEPQFYAWLLDHQQYAAWKQTIMAARVLDNVGRPTRNGVTS